MKIKTIRIAIALTAIISVSTLNAQEQQPLKVKEYGIGLSSFNSFSLQYRWGNEKRLYRINANLAGNTSFGNGSQTSSATRDTLSNNSTSSSNSKSPINFSCGLSFSILHLKSINEKFGLMYGGIAGVTYRYSTNESSGKSSTVLTNGTIGSSIDTQKNNDQTLQPYVGIVLGAFYKINSSFLLYAEIAPNIYYAYTQSMTNRTSSYTGTYNGTNTSNSTGSTNNIGISNLSNSGATLTIVYRITKGM